MLYKLWCWQTHQQRGNCHIQKKNGIDSLLLIYVLCTSEHGFNGAVNCTMSIICGIMHRWHSVINPFIYIGQALSNWAFSELQAYTLGYHPRK